MKKKASILSLGLATIALAAATALLGQSVTPPTAVNAATGDLILGFWQTDSAAAGYTSNVEVDLGAYSAYAAFAGGAPTHFNVTNIGPDLAATYGANWNKSATLWWGMVRAGGGTGGSTPDAVIGKINNNPAAGSTTLYDAGFTVTYTGSAARLINNKASALVSQVTGSANTDGIKLPSYTGSNTSAAIVPTVNAYSWSKISGVSTTSSATVFGATSNNPDYNIGNFAQGSVFVFVNGAATASYRVVDLFYLKFVGSGNATVTYVGSFGLQANGAITYANQSSYFSDAISAPIIATQPVSKTVTTGGSVVFSVVATGPGTLTYQWRKGGAAIPGETNASLALSNVTSANAASYDVIVTNFVASTTSAAATLTVNAVATPPTITTQPQSQTVTEGAGVTFTVTASGTGTLTYQWQKDGANISGATSSAFSLASVALTDAGSYTVVVSNGSPVTSNAAVLTVNALAPAPTITTQPVSQSVYEGTSVTFTVVASGAGTLTYQWRKDNIDLSGATGDTLTLHAVALGDAATYTVVVSNGRSVTSDPAVLTVNVLPPPTLTTQPASQTVYEGVTVSFGVVASGQGPFTYQWRKDGVAIPGATSDTLTLAGVTLSDAGSYTVVVSNGNTVTSDAAVLTVNVLPPAPVIATQPASQTVYVGANVSFNVVATGQGPFTYQWRKGGVAISGATSDTLTLVGVTLADAGTYTVVVSSGNTATSDAAILTVNPAVAPTITTQPASQTAFENETIAFTVVATGTPPFTYQWKKDNSAIAGATTDTLTVAHVAFTDAGSYTVVVTNGVDSVTSSPAVLTVNAGLRAPSITTPPASATVYETTSLTFSVGVAGSAPFSYQWKKSGVDIDGATGATFTLSNLTVADAGSYTVVVTNGAGFATSDPAILIVNAGPPPPVITTQPASQTAYEGTSINFTVAATATAPLSYQWRKNGSAIAGATSATYTLSNVTVADAGSYTVVVSDGNAVTSNAAVLTVNAGPTPPVITTQPVNKTVYESASASFTVTATGAGTLTYQWRKNGTAIPGATSATYTLSSVALPDAGSYTVVVSNGNAVTSNAAVLSVTALPPAPTISTQPASRTVYEGTNVVFSVVASGTGALSYQWYKNTVAIPGATGTSFSLTAVTVVDAGSYTVVVSNGNLTTSNAAVLTVNAGPTPPKITTQPLSQSVYAGTNVTLSVVANGLGTLTYQWWKNSTPINGATAATLTLNSVTSGDMGSYTVVVSNGNPTTSNAATVTVNPLPPAPTIATQPASQAVYEGVSVAFTVVATTTTGTLTYQWYKNAVAISGATRASYSLPSVAVADAGSYTVVVSNGTPTTSNPAVLTVNAGPTPPTITTQPASQTVYTGTNVTLSVVANGLGTLTYQWWKNSSPINGATAAALTPDPLHSVTVANSGSYTVVVSNGTPVTSNPAVLTVNAGPTPPVITSQPTSQSVYEGQTVYFSVLASGTGTLTYQWLKNGTAISGATNSVLTLINVTPADAGTYTVVVSNGNTVTSNPAVLTDNGPPPPAAPVAAAATAIVYNGFTANWASVTGATGYRLDVAADNAFANFVAGYKDLDVGLQTGWAVTNLSPSTPYYYRVRATNSYGASLNSNPISVTTAAPVAPVFSSVNTTSFTFGLASGFTFNAGNKPPPSFVATDLPAWAILDPSTGVLSGTPPAGTSGGIFTFVVTASNATKPDATQVFTLRVLPPPTSSSPLLVTTLAGQAGSDGSADGTGAAARFSWPLGLVADAAGNLYVADAKNQTILKITPAGAVTTLAGKSGVTGSADGAGTAATFNNPAGLAIDSNGVLYVADSLNHTIRRITPAGVVSTVAGIAGASGSDDTKPDGTGGPAKFKGPQGVAIDVLAGGNILYVADTSNHTIRKIVLATGAVSTLAGQVGTAGSSDGTGIAAAFNFPSGIAVGAPGRIFVADSANNAIRAVTASTGTVTTLAGAAGSYAAVDGVGAAARFMEPGAIVADPSGANVYVLDTGNHLVRKIATSSGFVATLAGEAGVSGTADGSGDTARFRAPAGLALTAQGLAIADTGNHTVRTGVFSAAVAITTQPASQTVVAGTSVTFTVAATGQPAPTYQWYRNGTAIAGATAASYTLASTQVADTGNYVAVAGNALGEVTSKTAVLTVNAPSEPVSSGGGGGGAPSAWFLAALVVLTLLRAAVRLSPKRPA